MRQSRVPHVTNLLRSPRPGRLATPPQIVEGQFDGPAASGAGCFSSVGWPYEMCDFDANEDSARLPGSTPEGWCGPIVARRLSAAEPRRGWASQRAIRRGTHAFVTLDSMSH